MAIGSGPAVAGTSGYIPSGEVDGFQRYAPKPKHAVGNHFEMRLGGEPTPAAAGTFLGQVRQAVTLAELALRADESILTLGYRPSDFAVNAKLRSLDLTPIIGDKVSTAQYISTIPDRSPGLVFSRLVDNPVGTFAAAGLKIRGGATKLEDGARIMLQDARSIPPLWFPVEVNVDRANMKVTFHSLDGHPLRGHNEFRVVRDFENAGAKIIQTSRFQASSQLTALGTRLGIGLDHQHNVWRNMHGGLFKALAPRI